MKDISADGTAVCVTAVPIGAVPVRSWHLQSRKKMVIM